MLSPGEDKRKTELGSTIFHFSNRRLMAVTAVVAARLIVFTWVLGLDLYGAFVGSV